MATPDTAALPSPTPPAFGGEYATREFTAPSAGTGLLFATRTRSVFAFAACAKRTSSESDLKLLLTSASEDRWSFLERFQDLKLKTAGSLLMTSAVQSATSFAP